ncbi:hypothetical protein CASFOL_032764 [Castilleja foliolosa]|uniref:BHLH domain-containing protein n=1 Tax=Castilleja foliolosa TaxID=1961234 RepID=A0ABD3C2F3_9LAMI
MRQPNGEPEINTVNSAMNHHQQLLSSLHDLHDHNQSSILPHTNFDPTSSQTDFVEQLLSSDAFSWTDDQPPPDVVEILGEHQPPPFLAEFDSKMRQQQMSNGPMNHADRNGIDYANLTNDASIKALFNGFTGSLGQTPNMLQQFHHLQGETMQQSQNFGAAAAIGMSQPAASGSSGGGATGQPKQRARARRGQATDPHSIAERLRRERIAERMKSLQELVPNANKTDKASMLDEIIDYVQFLQLQVKALSMSRLGGAASVVPLVADKSPEVKNGVSSTTNNEGTTVAERHLARLIEEDMGSAMQYLQGKGLCLMPISLATAISTTATSHSKNPLTTTSSNNSSLNGDAVGPTSPSISVLTVQSAVNDVPKLE